MRKSKLYIVYTIIVLGGVIIGAMFFMKKNIVFQIENDLKLDLTDCVSMIKYQRKKQYGENHLKVKLLIEKEKIQVIQEKLEDNLGKGNTVLNKELIPDFQNTCKWWDLDLDKKITYFNKMMAGKRAKTIEVWAFILEDNDQYFLYIVY